MSRLNFMTDHEDAMLTIEEDLRLLECAVARGYSFTPEELEQMQGWATRIQSLLLQNGTWETDTAPLPKWLVLKDKDEDTAVEMKTSIAS